MADPRSARQVGFPTEPDRLALCQTVESRVHAGAGPDRRILRCIHQHPAVEPLQHEAPLFAAVVLPRAVADRGVGPQAFVRLGVESQLAQMGPAEPDQIPVPAQRAPQPAVADVRQRLGDLDQLTVCRLDLGHDVERPLAAPAGKVQAVVEQPGAATVAPGGELADDSVLGSPRAERHFPHDQRVVREPLPQQRLEAGPIGDVRGLGGAGRRPVAASRRGEKAGRYVLVEVACQEGRVEGPKVETRLRDERQRAPAPRRAAAALLVQLRDGRVIRPATQKEAPQPVQGVAGRRRLPRKLPEPAVVRHESDAIAEEVHPEDGLPPVSRLPRALVEGAEPVRAGCRESDDGPCRLIHGYRVDAPVEIGRGSHLDTSLEERGHEVVVLRDPGGRVAGEQGRAMYRRAQSPRMRLAHEDLGDALALRVTERQPLDAVEEVVVLGDQARPAGGVADRETGDEMERLGPAVTGQSKQLPGGADVGGAECAVGSDLVDVGRGVIDGVDGRSQRRPDIGGEHERRLRQVPGHRLGPAAERVVPEAVTLEVPPNALLRFAVRSPVPNETQYLGVGLGQERPEQVRAEKAGGAGEQEARPAAARRAERRQGGCQTAARRRPASGLARGRYRVPTRAARVVQHADQHIEARVAGQVVGQQPVERILE